jgi:predicted nucleic acid-binding Zn ribbon protein
MFCANCGSQIEYANAVVCPKCGCGVAKNSSIKQGWNAFLMVIWVLISFLCPLFGWIMGGINLNTEKNSEGRRNQAIALIIIVSAGFVLWLGISIAAQQ